jgi:hypothetical protein
VGIRDWFSGGSNAVASTAIDSARGLVSGVRDAITGEEHQRKLAEIDARLLEAQADINKTEAQHASLFVAGWRPALGWVIVLSIGYTYIARPVVMAFGIEMPTVDTAALWPIILGMLGLAGYRTVEKSNGTQGRH